MLPAIAVGAVGCSPDTSRFGENPLGSPYASHAPANQVAVAPQAVERQPLPQAQYAQPQYAQPPYAQPQYGQPQYAQPPYAQPQYAPPPPPHPAPDVTGTVRSSAAGTWDWEGGTAITVAPGETIESISRKYGVPSQAIIQANAIANPAAIVVGQRLVIPRYNVNGTGAKLAHAAAPRQPANAAGAVAAPAAVPAIAHAPAQTPAPGPAAAPSGSVQTMLPAPPVHTVAAGDNLGKIARKYHVKLKELTLANGITPETPLKIGTQLTIPVKLVAAPAKGQPGQPVVPAGKPAVPPAAQAKATLPTPAKPPTGTHPAANSPGKVAAADPAPNARLAVSSEPLADEAAPAAGANGAPAFRWPLRGRVINNFGAKVNGANNDGIDLAVPEGTPVRAADEGVVAYSGNELKGYGNLVLVRHANGYVTAYANASELLVKRNDQVHKGQVIAKSGQTGTAPSPQLHFEVRKNSAPVDPMQYLPSDKTASAPL
jgi:murein DD-endopeptidase MepM/ murein hydrolase activator NlpD